MTVSLPGRWVRCRGRHTVRSQDSWSLQHRVSVRQRGLLPVVMCCTVPGNLVRRVPFPSSRESACSFLICLIQFQSGFELPRACACRACRACACVDMSESRPAAIGFAYVGQECAPIGAHSEKQKTTNLIARLMVFVLRRSWRFFNYLFFCVYFFALFFNL